MANKLTTPLVDGPYNHVYFRYMMDTPDSIVFDKKAPLYLDVETHRTDYSGVRTVQMYQEHWSQAVILDTNMVSVQAIYAEIQDMHIIAHMSTMEISCFQNELKPDNVTWADYRPDNPFKKFSDTFLLARRALYNKIDGFSLDKVAAYVHGIDYYKDYATQLGLTPARVEGYKKYMQKSFLDTPKSDKRNKPLAEEQLIYAALDVLVMPKIYNNLKHVESEFIITLDYMFINHCTRYQHIGLPLVTERWDEHMKEQLALMKEATDFLPAGFNTRSYKQVREILNSAASDDAYLAQVMDGSDLLANGEEACQFYGVEDPVHFEYRKSVAKYIRQYRSAVKRTEYLAAYKKQYDKFSRVKGYISPRTISGRVAGDECNMTNIPRSLKDLFGVDPSGSKCLLYADYSQLELRMTAAVLNEHAMVEKFMNDEDLHIYAGSEVFQKAPSVITKEERFIGKFFNFSATYGAGVTRLCSMLLKQAGMYMSEEDMRPLHQRWKKAWPQITNWHRINGRSRTNEDVTLLGRHYKAKMYTDLNAIKMQGSAAEVFKLAHLYMIKNKPDIQIGAAVHDSFISIEDKVNMETTAIVKAWSKVVAWFEVIQNSLVPTLKMPTTVRAGYNWGDIDNKGEFIYEYSIEGTHEQYMKARKIVAEGRILQELSFLQEIA